MLKSFMSVNSDTVYRNLRYLSFSNNLSVNFGFTMYLQVRHIVFLLCQFINYMEVTRLPVYYPSPLEKEYPKLFAANVRSLMATEV